ncbi:MAG: hypothetical protein A2Y64_00905 [Candidatus Coatesbacteria bacterium RBG_13_66_14]|uniref:Uncharacterized protein n=1 Tax=Candidatus Coatesbacteria bacterium RBG_13_66_14 TaxID=1817816 RepID=A0A1F5F4K8_9BACT|nr:MAG: hypothetical protein A2Y64_00905 [Candidatus Coatesbacteria bacterium RBG_13_66_14]
MLIRKLVFIAVLTVTLASAGLDRPRYVWSELYEPGIEIAGEGYSLRWTPWTETAVLERHGRTFELAMDDNGSLLGCMDGYLYFGQRDGSELLIRRMHTDDADMGFFVDMYELNIPSYYADFALSPEGDRLVVAAGGDEHRVEVTVYGLGRECEVLQERTFPVETDQIRVSVHLLEWSDDGESLYLNFHPHSPASDEFLDLQPLLRWNLTTDRVTEVLGEVGWVLPVAGRDGRTVILAEEIVDAPASWTMPWGCHAGFPPWGLARWWELDPAKGELTPLISADPPGAGPLFDGDPETAWRGDAVTVDLGRPLPLDGFLVVGGYAESGETTPDDTVTWDTWFELAPHESPYELRGSTERIPVNGVVETVELMCFPNNPDREERAVTAELVPLFAFWPVP